MSSQVTVTRDGALLSWRWLNIGLLVGSSEGIGCFCLAPAHSFTLPVRMSLSQPISFLTFTLPNLSRILVGRSEEVALWG